MDRAAIRQGVPGTIRMWLTILSIYRIINCTSNLKLSTITDPWKGEEKELIRIGREINDIIVFSKLKRNVSSLKVDFLHKTTAAGPNYNNSVASLLTDAITWGNFPELRQSFSEYCKLVNSERFDSLLTLWKDVAMDLYDHIGFEMFNITAPRGAHSSLQLGKLAFKVEPAGKVRVFAIVDSWTQSIFAPLHNDLFSFLRRLPNDGTFDQDLSFDRCLKKAKEYNMAFAFDLTAATDRLPIALQSKILDLLYIPGLGRLWTTLLTGREYIIRSNLFPDLTGDRVKYGTGQPMGCLSSWAMLAVTHHLIMQAAAFRCYGTRVWFDKYEVLGDDIVIFDSYVAAEYLIMMKSLDVGINLSKSLIAEGLQTVEFAKRTGLNGIDVSGLSWKQLISESTLTGRVSFALLLLRKGYIDSRSMLLRAIASNRYINFLDIYKPGKVRDEMENSIIYILGSFALRGKITLGAVVSLLIDPNYLGGARGVKPTVPMNKALQQILNLAADRYGFKPIKSKKPGRDLIADMFGLNPIKVNPAERIIANISLEALVKAKRLITAFIPSYEKKLAEATQDFLAKTRYDPLLNKMVPWDPIADLTPVRKLLITSLVEKILLKGFPEPEVVLAAVERAISKSESGQLTQPEAVTLLRQVEELVTCFDISKVNPTVGVEATLPNLLRDIAKAQRVVPPRSPQLRPLQEMMRNLEENRFMGTKFPSPIFGLYDEKFKG
jgi:hypothetical protein